jgi:nucleoside-diphosphate-sugar epimerase
MAPIASGTGVTIGDLVDQIVELTGCQDLVRRGALPDRPGEPLRLLANISRLKDEVGFRSQWGLADGLAATVRWRQENGTHGVGQPPAARLISSGTPIVAARGPKRST